MGISGASIGSQWLFQQFFPGRTEIWICFLWRDENGNGNGNAFIHRIFYSYIFKCGLHQRMSISDLILPTQPMKSEYPETNPGAGTRTNNKLKPRMTRTLGIEPQQHAVSCIQSQMVSCPFKRYTCVSQVQANTV